MEAIEELSEVYSYWEDEESRMIFKNRIGWYMTDESDYILDMLRNISNGNTLENKT